MDLRPPVSNTPISSASGLFGVWSCGLTRSTTGAPQLGGAVSFGWDDTGVMPQVAWPLTISPTATGPNRYMWTALTVSEPSGLGICSLNTTVNVSPTLETMPERV